MRRPDSVSVGDRNNPRDASPDLHPNCEGVHRYFVRQCLGRPVHLGACATEFSCSAADVWEERRMIHTNIGERVGKPDNDEAEICALCELGTFSREKTELSIRQSTDKGNVQCLDRKSVV